MWSGCGGYASAPEIESFENRGDWTATNGRCKTRSESKMMPEEYVAESVVEGLRDQVKGKRVLLVRAKVARDVIQIRYGLRAHQVDVVEAYETVVPLKSRDRLRTLMKDRIASRM